MESTRKEKREREHLRFGTRVLEEVDLAEVVSHCHHRLAVGATQGVDVGAVRTLQPHTWNTSIQNGHQCEPEEPRGGTWTNGAAVPPTHDMETQHAGVGGPLSVSALKAVPQQFAPCCDVPW